MNDSRILGALTVSNVASAIGIATVIQAMHTLLSVLALSVAITVNVVTLWKLLRPSPPKRRRARRSSKAA